MEIVQNLAQIHPENCVYSENQINGNVNESLLVDIKSIFYLKHLINFIMII
ncbi:hypothetical protein [Bacillus sp. AFS041924]|uniref:hypothetical protein n=1 Tax=Bacillus sp. AFS041924 TaxID=2033503 RepID=UPI00159BDDF5|nr:hypothetical protein [Bacillus sp. AFS041924]